MDLIQLSFGLLLFLFVIAIVAGLVDTLAGGGGLIVLPALITAGIPPLAALGTNKLQGSMGTATATFMMLRMKRIRGGHVKGMMLYAFVGAMIGTIAVQFISTDALSFVIPFVLIGIGLYFLFAPTLSSESGAPKIEHGPYQRMIVPLIGAYDGMFGPGTGSFFSLAAVSLRGQGLVDAIATAKALNFATNIASLIVFLLAGQIVWKVGLVMMTGQLIGALLGSHFLVKIDPKFLKWFVVIMSFSMLMSYVMK